MKLPLRIAAALLCAFAPRAAAADTGLQELLQGAAQGPEARAALAQARKQGQIAKAHWRAAYLPKVVGLGVFGEHDRDTRLGLFPLGQLPLGRQGWAAGFLAEQPLFDLEGMLYGARAAERGAEAAGLASLLAVKEAQSRALGYAFQALELRARRQALERYARNLDARHDEIQRLYELGAVGDADLLKVKLGVDDARQGARELEQKEALLAELLGQAMGLSAPARAADLPPKLPAAEPEAGGAVREDLLALDRQIAAAEAAEAGAESGFLPKVNATAFYARLDQRMLDQHEWTGVGATATWTLFDGAVRQAKAGAARAETESLQLRRHAAGAALQAQARDASGMLALRRQEWAERAQALAEAEQVATLEFGRLKRGRVSMNNLLDAEDLLKDRQEKAALSRVAWWQEWFRWQLCSGRALALPGSLEAKEALP